MFKTAMLYILYHRYFFTIAAYFLFSSILMATTDVDICIPCLWEKLFSFHCPGCGITTAFVNLIKFQIINAYNSNALIFILIPAGIYYFNADYKKFKQRLFTEKY
jgi:hypothetical protein